MDEDRRPGPEERDELTAIGALAEPNRRALYEHVIGQRGWVSREQAAQAVGLRPGIAAHHLDRLADEGLLETDYQRLSGRQGPGAGRPAKVYRRSAAELAVSLPARQYELAGQLLARAVDRSRSDGTPVGTALDEAAREKGRSIGAELQGRLGPQAGPAARQAFVLEALREHGFEPGAADDGATVLHNCPFHRLAQQHTELVCGMNLCLLEGLLGAVDDVGLRAELRPQPGGCCVQLQPVRRSRLRLPKPPLG